jgi:hypothetical protein
MNGMPSHALDRDEADVWRGGPTLADDRRMRHHGGHELA